LSLSASARMSGALLVSRTRRRQDQAAQAIVDRACHVRFPPLACCLHAACLRLHSKCAATGRLHLRQRLAEASESCGLQGNDPFASTPKAQSHSTKQCTYHLKHFTADCLPADVVDWAVDLTRRNLQHMYSDVWGWDEAEKRSQVNHVRCLQAPAVPRAGDDHTMRRTVDAQRSSAQRTSDC
jgi:hypothetical protein